MARSQTDAPLPPAGTASPPSDTTTPPSTTPSSETASVKDGILDEKKLQIGGSTLYDVHASEPLAPRKDESGSAGSGLLQIFGLKKREKVFDANAVRIASTGHWRSWRHRLMSFVTYTRSQRRRASSILSSLRTICRTRSGRIMKLSTRHSDGPSGTSKLQRGKSISRSSLGS